MHPTFAKNALEFFSNLEMPSNMPSGVTALSAFSDHDAALYLRAFISRYYKDAGSRIGVFGINPGRLGGASTGVHFTDAFALETYCGIENPLPKRREISSEFIYRFIESWGGPDAFYRQFFLSAIYPFGLVKEGKNFNYYDDPKFLEVSEAYIADTMRRQIDLGLSRETAIVLGTGKNRAVFVGLNDRYHFFRSISFLEHPRFIMQYNRPMLQNYINKYNDTFERALLAVTGSEFVKDSQ